jgi:hypothetical protein
MPDYFTALICQYSGAVNSAQAENYARSFVDAWYFTLPRDKQAKLLNLLPDYLKPKKQTFGFKRQSDFKGTQSEIFISRMTIDLARTGNDESKYIVKGLMKSLKIISSPEQKFAYSRLLDSKLYDLYVGA